VVIGLLAVVLSLIAISPPIRRLNWYRLRPTAWVVDDLRSTDYSLAYQAWRELQRREGAQRLSDRYRSDIIQICLAEQKKEEPWQALVDYLWECYCDDELSEGQKDQFFWQMSRREFHFRPRVVRGEGIPYQLIFCGRAPMTPGVIRYNMRSSLALDGKPFGNPDRSAAWATGWNKGVASPGSSGFVNSVLPYNTPGIHLIRINIHLLTFYAPPGHETEQLCHEQDVEFEYQVEVLENETPDYIRFISDPTQKADLLASIRPYLVTYEPNRHLWLAVEFEFDNVPVNVAFDVIARIGEKEFEVDDFHARQGESGSRFTRYWETVAPVSERRHLPEGYTGPSFDVCDIILRSSKRAARASVDLFEIWDGELIYQDVPFRGYGN